LFLARAVALLLELWPLVDGVAGLSLRVRHLRTHERDVRTALARTATARTIGGTGTSGDATNPDTSTPHCNETRDRSRSSTGSRVLTEKTQTPLSRLLFSTSGCIMLRVHELACSRCHWVSRSSTV
jgi:hypothetical protein